MMNFDMVTPTTGNDSYGRVFANFETEEESFDIELDDELTITDEDLEDILVELNNTAEDFDTELEILLDEIDEFDDIYETDDFDEADDTELEYDDIFTGDCGFTAGSVFNGPFSQDNAVSFNDSYLNISEGQAQIIEEEISYFFSETTAAPDVIAICFAIMLSLRESGRKLDEISDLEITIKANMVIDRDERTQIKKVIPELRYIIELIENAFDDKYNKRLYKYYHLFFQNP